MEEPGPIYVIEKFGLERRLNEGVIVCLLLLCGIITPEDLSAHGFLQSGRLPKN